MCFERLSLRTFLGIGQKLFKLLLKNNYGHLFLFAIYLVKYVCKNNFSKSCSFIFCFWLLLLLFFKLLLVFILCFLVKLVSL